MPNISVHVDNVAQKVSGFEDRHQQRADNKRSNWRPTNLNIERFILDECGNMSQTQKIPVTATSQGGTSTQQPIRQDVESGQVKRSSTASLRVSDVKQPVPPSRRGGFSCGWFSLMLVGSLCLLFLLLINLVPSEGIFPVGINLLAPQGNYFNKTGELMVYPGELSDDAIRRKVPDSYVISTNPDNWKNIINVLDNATSVYNKSTCTNSLPKPYVNCYLENPTDSNPCIFERDWLGSSCVSETNYGYKEVNGIINPCFMISILRSEDWYPINWAPQEGSNLYKEMYGSSFIGLVCHVEGNDISKNVRLSQNPVKGFPQDFFPVSRFKTGEYIHPAVMVQLHDLKVGQNINVSCQLRARNAFVLRGSGSIVIKFQGNKTAPKTDLLTAEKMEVHDTERTSEGSSLEGRSIGARNISSKSISL